MQNIFKLKPDAPFNFSLSHLNLNLPRKLSIFAMKLEPLRRGKGEAWLNSFLIHFELSAPKIANQVSSLGLHIYKLLQFFLVSHQVVIQCMCKKYFFFF